MIKPFLFKNITIKQTILKNVFWLAIAEGIVQLFGLFLIVYVARILGATEFGKFSFALAFVSLFAIFFDFGLSRIITREFARDKEKEKEFSSILSLKALLGLGTLILVFAGSFFITPDPIIQKVIWILAVYVFVINFSDIIYAFLRARQQMEYEAFAKILQAIIITIIGFYIILNFPSIENLSYGYLFAGLISLTILLLFFNFKIYRLYFKRDKRIWKKFLTMAWPLTLLAIFGTIYTNIDSIMLGYLGQITETGWYNAAHKLVRGTLILTVLISQSFYPVLSSVFQESKEKLQKIWNYHMEIMILFAVPLIVGGITLASKIINFIYNPNYAPSVLAFQILIVMAGIVFLCSPFGQILIVFNQQKKYFWGVLFGTIINVILNLILIPKYSLYGAAVATLITFLFILFLLLRVTIKFTSIKLLEPKFLTSFIVACLSSLLMYFTIIHSQIYSLNVLFIILIGTAIYLISLFMFNKIYGHLLW